MSAVAITSVKHGPGATTAAVALAAAWEDALVVEADPAGGDIAARARLPLEPGLVSLAAAGRHPGARLDLDRHAQALPSGGAVIVAPAIPELATNAVSTLGARLAEALTGRNGVIDCGRLSPASPSTALAASSDRLLVVAEPTVGAVEHIRVRLPFLRDVDPDLAVVLVGDRPYGPRDVEEALGVTVGGVIAVDPRGVAMLFAGTGSRRSVVVRSARSVLDRIYPVTVLREAVKA